jgi:hypothetical protein
VNPVDTLFVVYVFFGPLIGLALALAFGTSSKRAAVLSLCGVLAIAGLVVARWAFGDTDPDSTACGECVDYWGHYFSRLVFVFAAMNVLAWYVGVAVGARLRRSRTFTDADWAHGLISGSVGAFAFVAFLFAS